MSRKRLKARDIERLENTSGAGIGTGVPLQGSPLDITGTCATPLNPTWTCDCNVCVLETDCCGVTGSTPDCGQTVITAQLDLAQDEAR